MILLFVLKGQSAIPKPSWSTCKCSPLFPTHAAMHYMLCLISHGTAFSGVGYPWTFVDCSGIWLVALFGSAC